MVKHVARRSPALMRDFNAGKLWRGSGALSAAAVLKVGHICVSLSVVSLLNLDLHRSRMQPLGLAVCVWWLLCLGVAMLRPSSVRSPTSMWVQSVTSTTARPHSRPPSPKVANPLLASTLGGTVPHHSLSRSAGLIPSCLLHTLTVPSLPYRTCFFGMGFHTLLMRMLSKYCSSCFDWQCQVQGLRGDRQRTRGEGARDHNRGSACRVHHSQAALRTH